jgi:CelD/BcsL family acetyltransferase involved in cellulose biosynthesis/glycosyltransferase involved in cell wall biosynthesis
MLSVLQVSYAAACVSRDAVGGAEQVLATLDAALAARGWDVSVVAPTGSRTAGRLFASGPLGDALGPATLAEVIEAQAAVVRRALAAHRFDLVHLHGLHFDRVLPPDHPPALVTLHLPAAWYAPGALAPRDGISFACVSETQARTLPPGAPLTCIVPNGVSLELFRPGGDREPFALVLARIAPEKGLHFALDAARAAGTPLVAGGEVFPYPDHVRYFEAEVRPRLDAQRAFLGPIGLAEKVRLLSRARCLIVPSLAPETSSLVAMEALACGTPVVARRVGALPEIIEDGRTGFLVDTVDEMASAIREVSRLSAAACRRAAEERFSHEAMIRRYAAAYARVVHRTPPSRSRVRALRIEEVDGADALAKLEHAWTDLADRDPEATPFQRPEWLLPYCRAFGVTSPWAVSAWSGDRLAALAPLVVYEKDGRRIATLLGGGRSDWQDALVDPDLAPDAANALLDRIAAGRDRYDALVLERLPPHGWLARAEAPDALGATEEEEEPCPVIALPSAVEALESVIGSGVLANARYGRRRLARIGPTAIVETTAADVDRHLCALFDLHGARWSARGQAGVLRDPTVRRFHLDAARALAASGRLRGYRLVVGDRVAAVWHGFEDRRRLYYYLGGFDPAFRAASPGAVLLAHAIEEAVRRGVRELDLLRGREPYKYAWGAVDRWALRRVLAPGAPSRDEERRGQAAKRRSRPPGLADVDGPAATGR